MSRITAPLTNSNDIPEITLVSSPEHCWSFSKIYFNGNWFTVTVPWNVSPPWMNQNYGPWGIAGLPGVPVPPPPGCCGSGTFQGEFNHSLNTTFRHLAGNAVHDFVQNELSLMGASSMNVGDKIIFEILNPNQYMTASAFGNFPVGMNVSKYCLKYEGIKSDWTHPWSHYGNVNQTSHYHAISCPASLDCSCIPPPPPTLCNFYDPNAPNYNPYCAGTSATTSGNSLISDLTTQVATGAQTFLTYMENGYNLYGCDFFATRLNHQIDKLYGNVTLGISPATNNTEILQRQAKIDWMQCIIGGFGGASDDCCDACNFHIYSPCSMNHIQGTQYGYPNLFSSPQQFLGNMAVGFIRYGCDWLLKRIAFWYDKLNLLGFTGYYTLQQTWTNNTLPPGATPGQLKKIARHRKRIEWAYCMLLDPDCSCNEFFVSGCKDPSASNYDPSSLQDCHGNMLYSLAYAHGGVANPTPSGNTSFGDASCCSYEILTTPPGPGVEYNWRFGKTGVDLNIGQHQTNNTMFDGGMFMPGGAYLNPGKRFGNQNDTTTNPLWVGLNPLSTQLIPNRQVTDPAVYNSASWYNVPIQLFHLQTNMADGNILGIFPNEYHITVWDSKENLRGKWKYGLGVGPSTGAPSSGCGAISPCYRYWGFHFISHLAGDPQVVPQHGDFMKIEYWKEYPNDWSAWHAPTIQNWINNILVWNPPANQTPYTQAAFNAWSLPTTPFSNSADLVNYAGTGTDIRFNWMGQQGGQPIPFWKECIDSCTSPQLTNGNGCREWFPQRPPMLAPPFGAYPLAPPVQQGGPVDCCSGITMPMLGGSIAKLSSYELGGFCATNTVTTKSIYDKNENQTVEVTHEDTLGENDTLFNEEENDVQKISTFTNNIIPDSTKNIFNITFKTKSGYYYSKPPSVTMNFPGTENYKIKTESQIKNTRGYVTEKTFSVSYKNTGFDILESDGHNIVFTNKIVKEVKRSTKFKKISALRVDTSSISGVGESRDISIVGTPGSIFSLTIKDKNNRNVLPYSSVVTKTIKTAATASNILEIDNAVNLEVGMLLLNGQKRNVKITSIVDTVKANVDAINETSTVNVSISSFLTFSVDDYVTFVKESELTEVTIPNSGVYSFTQKFPPLEKFKRTLKTAASSATALTLDYNDDLEGAMKITGTGVDGNDPIIVDDSTGVSADGVQITVSDSQTIDDETDLTFEMPDNRYDITLYPITAVLEDDVPRYSSKDCDTLPTYSIYQYINPIVQITPATTISSAKTTGGIVITGKANRTTGVNGDIDISMTVTKNASMTTSRNPRFSNTDSTISDFSNTINNTVKTVRNDGCWDSDIVHLNNTTGIRTGMIVTGSDIDPRVIVTVKSVTGTAVKFSSKQTIQKNAELTFSSLFNMYIDGLSATLSANGGISDGVCTITGTGKIESFGVDSFTSTFDLDNFLTLSGGG